MEEEEEEEEGRIKGQKGRGGVKEKWSCERFKDHNLDSSRDSRTRGKKS